MVRRCNVGCRVIHYRCYSVPVPINVRCYSDSDVTVRRSEVTVKASSTKGLATLYDALKQRQERPDFTNLKGLP